MAAALRFPELEDSPPGVHYDEAANGILAGDIGLRGERPIFISSYTGKETLFFYLAGGLMSLLGQSIFTLRLTAALLGVATVAATYRLGVELLRDRRMALLAAGLLAVSFWHLLFSRLGFRAVSQPLLQALAVTGIWHGLRRGSRLSLIGGGVALGLTAYTYLAARLFPIPLAIGLGAFLIGRKRPNDNRWRKVLLVVLVSLAVAGPLLAYFAANPDSFWVRVNQVLPDNTPASGFGRSYLKALGMFFIEGDPYVRFNIPGLTLMGPYWGSLLALGWLLALVRWRWGSTALERSAHLFLAALPPLMLLPSALAAGEIVPSNLRAIGLLPFVFLLPSMALFFVLDLLWKGLMPRQAIASRPATGRDRGEESGQIAPYGHTSQGRKGDKAAFRRSRWTDGQLAAAIVVGLLLAVGGPLTGRRYFIDWAERADLLLESDGDLVATASFLDQMDLTDETIFVSALHYRHPTMAFLSQRYEDIKWLPGSEAVVFPEQGEAVYIYPHNSPRPEWAAGFLPDSTEIQPPHTGTGLSGQPLFKAYRRSGPPQLVPEVLVNANFGDNITLLGYEFGPLNEDSLALNLYWRIDRPPPGGLMPFVHLEDAWHYRWGQVESVAYPAEQWAAGETVVQQVRTPLRPGLPPGDYRLHIGLFDPESGRQVSRLDAAGRYAGNAFTVEAVPLANVALPETISAPESLDLVAGPNLRLLGYERQGYKVASGAPIWLGLWWAASGPLDPMVSRLELVREDNTGLILSNSQPVHDTYPFDSWLGPQFVIDHQTPRIPPSFAPGDYRLSLRLLDSGNRTILTADLGSLTIEASDRIYSPPSVQYPLQATFGDEIKLLGYDLGASGDGTFALKLVWQAIEEPADSYTVFVHALNLDGSCCLWQADLWPMGGTYPTNKWLKGEVVVDPYDIEMPLDLPPGNYPLEVGMFLAESGRRLLIEMPGIRPDDALILRPLVVE